jgi:hypothetical protein
MNLIDTPNIDSATTTGEDQHHYRQNSSGSDGAQGTSVPSKWHGSNRESVIGKRLYTPQDRLRFGLQ